MKIRSIKYYVREAARSLLRNRLMTVASVFTVFSCSLMLIISVCVASNISYILEQLGNKVGISAYINFELTADEVNILYNKISDMPNVKSVEFISSEKALEIWAEMFDSEDWLLEGFKDDNPLPRSFTITLYDNVNQDEIISEVERLKGIDSMGIKGEEVTDALISIGSAVTLFSVILILTLALISIVIITNTIKLTVNNRSREIGIMKYVGATDWFIRWPFVIEGILIGLIGSIIPGVIGWVGYDEILKRITAIPMIEGIADFRSAGELFVFLLPITLLGGILIGALGSAISMRKYLRV